MGDKGKTGLAEERRFLLRRLTVRRRHERSGSDRRLSERRRPVARLAQAWIGSLRQLSGSIGILAI